MQFCFLISIQVDMLNYIITDSYYFNERNTLIFIKDNWDDYGYKTSFNVSYIDDEGRQKSIGSIKIGVVGAVSNFSTYDSIPSLFNKLPEYAFSLWQSADSYQKVKKLVDSIGVNIFDDLNDIAYNLELLEKYKSEAITQNSLLRGISRITVKQQFHRITIGQAKLTKFNFSYEIDKGVKEAILNFDVVPNSYPPSNVHALIGGNGVGKSTLIKEMIAGIFEEKSSKGRFVYNTDYDNEDKEPNHFANVICVGFSPFDDFSSVEKYANRNGAFTYIGTRKDYNSSGYEDGYGEINLLEDIEKQFLDSLKDCLSNISKREDLSSVVKILENDPMFYDYRLDDLIVSSNCVVDYKNLKTFKTMFSRMSSGHKVVLSIIVRCIDKMAEKTILFLDEPENHLHPPLVSSLVRAISHILMKRNGVAVVSTHSPIVLQETPKSCVWMLSRTGNSWNIMRPRFETFGENIGTLTNDIFRYEVSNTGFHAMLKQSVIESDSYEEVVEKYNYQLGDEARGVLRVLFSQKARGEL